jgi:hypothetical protein
MTHLTSDYLHIAAAGATFLLLVIAMSTITTNLTTKGLVAVSSAVHVMVTVAYDSLIAYAICFAIPPLRRISGLVERVFLASTLAWVLTIAFLLL